jgi:putative peptide zinc metalloprotease protein
MSDHAEDCNKMVTATVGPEAEVECEKRYAIRDHLEIFPLSSSSREQKYVVRLGDEKSYVISENLKRVLELLNGTRTLTEVAEALSAEQRTRVTDAQMREVVRRLIKQYDLIKEVADESQSDRLSTSHLETQKRKKFSLELALHFPIIPMRLALPVTSRLTWLFDPLIVTISLASIALAHLALFSGWFGPFPTLPFGPSDILFYYGLALATSLFHEFGHATACRRYDCEHGAIGFLLYMVFPALYINLSNAWRLPGRQRAVVDIGGIYFQLLTTVPFYIAYLCLGDPRYAAVILSIDLMALISLNPVLKFDGYWLLVDLSGLVNLRARSWRVAKEVVLWGVGRNESIPTLNEISGRGKKLLLVTYSFLAIGMFSSFVFFLITFAPSRIVLLAGSVQQVVGGNAKGVMPIVKHLSNLLVGLVFLIFVYRLLKNTLFHLFKRLSWRHRS